MSVHPRPCGLKGLMAQGHWGKPIARRLFEQAKAGYHPTIAAGVAKIVGGG